MWIAGKGLSRNLKMLDGNEDKVLEGEVIHTKPREINQLQEFLNTYKYKEPIEVKAEECQHESDGKCYYPDGEICTDFIIFAAADSPCKRKCKKCGEFYR